MSTALDTNCPLLARPNQRLKQTAAAYARSVRRHPPTATTRSLTLVAATFLLLTGCRKAAEPGQQPINPAGTSSTTALNALDDSPAGSILTSLQSQLRRVNPSITLVEIHDIEHIDQRSVFDSTWYIVLALGHGIHRGWKDSSQVGEIFGVFGVDSTFSHVTLTYGMFPTPRLGDWHLFFDHRQEVSDSIVVFGTSPTYGGPPARRAYAR